MNDKGSLWRRNYNIDMTYQVTLTISDKTYHQARQMAQQQARRVEEILADAIVLDDVLVPIDWTEPNGALNRERDAYVTMHPQLKQTMKGKHVAVFGGKLVDHDDNFDNLVERIREMYPQQTVWLTTVDEEPIDTIHMRSPHLLTE